jgi:hypothetical protein
MPRGIPIGDPDPKRLKALVAAQKQLDKATKDRNKALADAVGYVHQDKLAEVIGNVSPSTLWRRINEGRAGKRKS